MAETNIKSRKIATQAAMGVSLCCMLSAPAAAELLTPKDVVDVSQYLIGVMDTSEQAQSDPNFVSVQMTTCVIEPQTSDPNSVYLYQEQALSHKLHQPYRQRFLQLTLSDNQTRVESRTFKPTDTDELIGLCDSPQPIALAKLGQPVCTVALRPSILGFVGRTPDEGCPVTMRGATRLTNVVVLHGDGMDTWDRGFDAEGAQLWGAKQEPYRYRWVGQ